MKRYRLVERGLTAVLVAVTLLPPTLNAASHDDDDALPAAVLPNTGQQITPLAPRGAQFRPLNPGFSDNPQYEAGQGVSTVVSPNGNTLLVLTSGYNRINNSSGKNIPAESTQFVFVYDISHDLPVKTQVIQIPNTYNGIAFDPSGTAFYVAGGVDDDVHIYGLAQDGTWTEQAGSPVKLGHSAGVGLSVAPQAAGVAITQDGTKLVVTNYYNDSISILTKSSNTGVWAVSSEIDLRPGKLNPASSGIPGGEYPYWAVIKGNDTAYVSSIRDREVVEVSLGSLSVISRIHLPGQPNKMILNADQSLLFVAQDNNDSVAVISTASNQLVANIAVTAPVGLLPQAESKFKGDDTNSVSLSPDGKFLYLSNGWMNNVAVVELDPVLNRSRVVGLIPTGWYPNSVSFSRDAKYVYVVNGKSPTGPNPGYCHGLTPQQSAQCSASNQYDLQLIKAGFQFFPAPAAADLGPLTEQVAKNNHFRRSLSQEDAAKIGFLRQHIHHVIYIIKENRTYDQILGDLEVGNGDPSITQFPEATTPNFHQLARQFVDLDSFYDTSEVSYDGWAWSTAAHAPDLVERQTPVNYAGRGLSYDSEGTNRNVNISYGTLAERLQANPLTPNDPDILPGRANAAAPDGPDGQENAGYLWNGAIRAGLSVRNYGFFIDLARYNLPAPYTSLSIPELTNPAASNTTVAYVTNESLRSLTDPYFRGFDMSMPDFYRFKEWEREFDTNYAKGGLPDLTLLRLPHDHTGNFGNSLDGVNTPELDIADNDYAVGLVAQKIANSRYKSDTLIFVIEDDSQDGGDHVDAHRSTAFVIGPYVKQGAVVSTPYTTLSMFRTIEDILGIGYENLNDALAVPMTDVFDPSQKTWTYKATPSDLLYGTQLPLPAQASLHRLHPTHDGAYWATATKGMDFSVEDRMDYDGYNHILWTGLMGDKPYPTRSGLDLRLNRSQLLQGYHAESKQGGNQPAEPPAAKATPPSGSGQ